MKRWAWIAFWILGVTWGSSFLLIKISVEVIPPAQVVFIRTAIAGVGLMLLALARGLKFPSNWSNLFPLILIGIGNTAIPFLLITWGETAIDSSVASILQATASLFTLVIAHFFFADERMTPQRIGGMILGFLGVIVLFAPSIRGSGIAIAVILGQLAIVLASLFYAMFTTYSRVVLNGRGIAPLVVAAVSQSSAAVIMGVITFLSPLFGGSTPVSLLEIPREVSIAVIVLGIFNTCFAYALFYSVVSILGAARASMVTYVVPVVGLVLGIVFLDEPLTWALGIGALLVFAGIGVVNLRLGRTKPVEVVPSKI
jgi:drug/metabolite transporter (DMT)-like permease